MNKRSNISLLLNEIKKFGNMNEAISHDAPELRHFENVGRTPIDKFLNKHMPYMGGYTKIREIKYKMQVEEYNEIEKFGYIYLDTIEKEKIKNYKSSDIIYFLILEDWDGATSYKVFNEKEFSVFSKQAIINITDWENINLMTDEFKSFLNKYKSLLPKSDTAWRGLESDFIRMGLFEPIYEYLRKNGFRRDSIKKSINDLNNSF